MKKEHMSTGISLIVLVITIVVIIILAGAVILSLTVNNPIEQARKARFQSDIDTFNSELTLWLAREYSSTLGALDINTVNANKTTGEYKGLKIQQIIQSMNDEYANKLEIQKGKLVYVGTDLKEQEWASQVGNGTGTNTNLPPQIPPEQVGYDANKGVNKPKLATGLVAKKWNATASTWDTVADPENDTSWYDYANKEWANAQTADGSMWVWIPRYIYKISTGWHSNTIGTIDVQFSKGIDDDWNSTITLNTSANADASNNTWTNHPAFTFGTQDLTGIWVAKFEASGNSGSGIKILPGVTAWKSVGEQAIFTACRSMETSSNYGWGTTGTGIDTHQMKNTEWGAVAYLSKSIYGKNTSEVAINTNSLAMTSTVINASRSTTGNSTGIFDMSGGLSEYVAAYVSNGNPNLTAYADALIKAEGKYKDVYTVGSNDDASHNYANTLTGKKGDAVYETSNAFSGAGAWYSDYSQMSNTSNPIFRRGGYYDETTAAGVYAFSPGDGSSNSYYGFRPVLCVDSVL